MELRCVEQQGTRSKRRRQFLHCASCAAALASTAAQAAQWKSRWRRGTEVKSLSKSRVRVADAITNSGVSQALATPPSTWPFTAEDFRRWDEGDDAKGFLEPSFERHIDDPARLAIERLYADLLVDAPPDLAVLDLCASWDSHLPAKSYSRVALLGMNELELEANTAATEVRIHDLNDDPSIPFGSSQFDVVTLALGIQYLARPREVFAEMHRVLRPGGLAVVAFSSRSFPWKAVAVWSRSFHDGVTQCRTVGTYFLFAPPGGWSDITPLDLSPHRASIVGSDELWAVIATKS